MSISIKALYVNYFTDKLIAYVALQLIKNFNDGQVSAALWGTASNHSIDGYRKISLEQDGNVIERILYRDAIPAILQPLLLRLPGKFIASCVEWKFLKQLKPHDIVYLYPGCSLELYKKVKRKGCIIVAERINTLRQNSKRILDAEYHRLNQSPGHNITEESADREIEALHITDFIYSPSPAVTQSIKQAGISQEKILQTTYGLKKDEIFSAPEGKDNKKKITVLFAGSIGVRKGVHLLLDAWKIAEIEEGKLKLIGSVSPSFQNLLHHHENDPSVERLDFVDDLRPHYREADIFVLPSLEEGSPLVTYLALGASLPVIASPMGSGGIIEDGREGIIIDPHNLEEFAEALRHLSRNEEVRKKMSCAAREKASRYIWENVASQRKRLLLDKLSKRFPSEPT